LQTLIATPYCTAIDASHVSPASLHYAFQPADKDMAYFGFVYNKEELRGDFSL